MAGYKRSVSYKQLFSDNVVMVQRTRKDGSRKGISCPVMLQIYNQNMGGVHLTDLIVGSNDFDKKSRKWWKKVFYNILMMAVAKVHVLHQDLHRTKLPFTISYHCS